MLNGKTAIVTGGSRGIGAAIAEKLAQDGFDVLINCASSVEKAEAVAEKCRAHGVNAYVKKWDVAGGNLNMEILLSEGEKAKFESFVAAKYKDLLDKGLDVKVGNLEEGFVIQPKDGGFQIAFSEKLFEAFFNQYMKGFTKKLLFKD